MIKKYFKRAVVGLALAIWMLSILILASGIFTIFWGLFFEEISIKLVEFIIYMLLSGFACVTGILCFDKILDWGYEE